MEKIFTQGECGALTQMKLWWASLYHDKTTLVLSANKGEV